jgi:predicted enzyme related to lactoylglutathione lyase
MTNNVEAKISISNDIKIRRNKVDPVIHFEMPAENAERVRTFYESAFGWQTTPLGPEAGDFVLAFTIETDEQTRMPKKRGAINGGFYKKTEPDQHTRLTILVEDMQEAVKKVEAAGGTLIGDVQEMPGVGLFASFLDTEGNLLTLNQDFTIKRI